MGLVGCRPTSDRILINFVNVTGAYVSTFIHLLRVYVCLLTCSFSGRGVSAILTFFAIIGEITEDSSITGSEEDKKIKGTSNTKFRLVGIVVHSGQASGGHYYSYVLQR